jgi:hypothetical protein
VAINPFTSEDSEWMECCRREIAAIEDQLRAGHPDLQGLCLALADWSAELRILRGACHASAEEPSEETGSTDR